MLASVAYYGTNLLQLNNKEIDLCKKYFGNYSLDQMKQMAGVS